jgi:hypothetical protein
VNGRGLEYNEGVSQSVITNILDAVKRFHSSRRQVLAQPTSSSVKQAQPVDALFPIPNTRPFTCIADRSQLLQLSTAQLQNLNSSAFLNRRLLLSEKPADNKIGMLHTHWCGRYGNSRGYIIRRGYGSGEYSIGFQQWPSTFPNTAMSSLRDFVGSRALKWQVSYGSVDSKKIHGNDI